MPDAEPPIIADSNGGSVSLTQLPARPRFSLRVFFIVITGLILVASGVAAISQRSAAARAQARVRYFLASKHELFESREALKPYYKSADLPWPPNEPQDNSGQPLFSWRMVVVEDLGPPSDMGISPSIDVSKAWNAQDPRLDHELNYFGYNGQTNVFAVTGPDTAFDRNLFENYSRVPGNVIVLIEVRDSKTRWMQPGDYNVTDLLAFRGRIGDHLHGLLPGRLHVLFADGEVWALDSRAPIADLQPFLTITGAKSHDRDQLLGRHKVD